jgi:hypothetical protein
MTMNTGSPPAPVTQVSSVAGPGNFSRATCIFRTSTSIAAPPPPGLIPCIHANVASPCTHITPVPSGPVTMP